MVAFTALLDANVLFPFHLRDVLIGLGQKGIYRAKWTEQIQDEWQNALLRKRPDLNAGALARTRDLMNRSIADCLIEGYDDVTSTLALPDLDDRHVLAAAIVGRADAIVTFNLKDFPMSIMTDFGIEAIHPDDFLVAQLDLSQGLVLETLRERRAALTSPAYTADEYIGALEKPGLTSFAARLRSVAALI